MDEKSIMEKAKQEACMDLMQDTACKIKKLIAPFKSFPNDKKDPVVAVTWDLSIDLVVVEALVACVIFLFCHSDGNDSPLYRHARWHDSRSSSSYLLFSRSQLQKRTGQAVVLE